MLSFYTLNGLYSLMHNKSQSLTSPEPMEGDKTDKCIMATETRHKTPMKHTWTYYQLCTTISCGYTCSIPHCFLILSYLSEILGKIRLDRKSHSNLQNWLNSNNSFTLLIRKLDTIPLSESIHTFRVLSNILKQNIVKLLLESHKLQEEEYVWRGNYVLIYIGQKVKNIYFLILTN